MKPDAAENDAVALHDQAVALQAQGRHAEAEVCCRRSLSILQETDGPEHPDVANVMNTLASLCAGQGRPTEAEEHAIRALAMMEKLADVVEGIEAHQILIQSLSLLGDIYRARGSYAEAERFLTRALSEAESGLGADHPETFGARNNLGVLYKYTGEFDKAERLYREALESAERVGGPDHPPVATIYHNLGGLEHARNRFMEAEPLARRGYEIRCRALGPDHPEAVADGAALASILDALGRHGEAEPLFRHAWKCSSVCTGRSITKLP